RVGPCWTQFVLRDGWPATRGPCLYRRLARGPSLTRFVRVDLYSWPTHGAHLRPNSSGRDVSVRQWKHSSEPMRVPLEQCNVSTHIGTAHGASVGRRREGRHPRRHPARSRDARTVAVEGTNGDDDTPRSAPLRVVDAPQTSKHAPPSVAIFEEDRAQRRRFQAVPLATSSSCSSATHARVRSQTASVLKDQSATKCSLHAMLYVMKFATVRRLLLH
ncbi:hypothetical protein GW17_00015778, partial [Ensete ventricosum]